MKLFTILIILCCALLFSSCVDRMDINDVEDGTPTRIDTIIKRNYVRPVKKEPVKKEESAESE